MSKLKDIGLVISKEIYNVSVFIVNLVFFIAIAMPIILIWLYIILTFDGAQINDIPLSQFIANRNIQYFSFFIVVGIYGVFRLFGFGCQPDKASISLARGASLNKLN